MITRIFEYENGIIIADETYLKPEERKNLPEGTVPVSRAVFDCITESVRKEMNGDRKERNHCSSLDAMGAAVETLVCVPPSEYEGIIGKDVLLDVYRKLTSVERRRVDCIVAGMTATQIAREEGVTKQSISKSMRDTRKKFTLALECA